MERQHEDLDDEVEEEEEDEDDAESEMDSESEGASTKVVVDVQDFETGLRELEARGAGAPGTVDNFHKVALVDSSSYRGASDDEDDDANETVGIVGAAPRHDVRRRQFARFVTLLDRYGRERVRGVTFVSIQFDELGFHEADLDRLFGQVLPTFPLLDRLRFEFGSLPGAHRLGRFAARLSSERARRGGDGDGAWSGRRRPPLLDVLDLEDCAGDVAAFVPALAAALRGNVPIRSLNVTVLQSLGRDECRQLFHSLQHNSILQFLEVNVDEVHDGEDALVLPSDPTSGLRYLSIYAREWSAAGRSSLTRQLKTNTLLEDLRISYTSAPPGLQDHRPWIEMLESYNYTLSFLHEDGASDPGTTTGGPLHDDERIAALLQRNAWIRGGLGRLRGNYRVSPAALLPRALHVVRALPTLIFRFVRIGNVDALADLLLVADRQQQQTSSASSDKRSRATSLPRRSIRIARLRK
jgi:hypothetical protein